jgi:methylthioribulose-1-phosphate dehydratase
MLSDAHMELASDLLEAIRFFNLKGWSPATSTNYSIRSQKPTEFIISRSGVDKSKFSLDDFILINGTGDVLPPFNRPGIKSSAETEIHTYLYQTFPDINCVLHTHSVLGTVLSYVLASEKQLIFDGLEIQKGLEGNTTHQLQTVLPIVANSQKMSDIIESLSPILAKDPGIHGFLIAGHGLYTWGKDLSTTKRHIETFEFLFECYEKMRRL